MMGGFMRLIPLQDLMPVPQPSNWVVESPLGTQVEVGIDSPEEDLCQEFTAWSSGRRGSEQSWHGWFDELCSTARPELVAELLFASGKHIEFDALVLTSSAARQHLLGLKEFVSEADFRERSGELAAHRVRSLVARELALCALSEAVRGRR